MKDSILDKYIEGIEQDSREFSFDGSVSYPYVTGVLISMLRGALSDYPRVREVTERMIKEAVDNDD